MNADSSPRGRLSDYMSARGMKQTRQRDLILDIFLTAGRHLSVDDLTRLVQAQMPGLGVATVYRSLKLFADAGVAVERHFQDGQARYEPVQDEHHDHLICTTCGAIFEFEDPEIEARQAAVAEQFGLRVVSHRHEIYGACREPDTCAHGASARAGTHAVAGPTASRR